MLRSTLLVAALVLVAAPSASAHGNRLVGTDPADGERVMTAIDEVVATYSAQPRIDDPIRVVAPSGTSRRVAADVRGSRVLVPFDASESGTWQLAWQVVQLDGHAVDYELSFTIDQSVLDARARVEVLELLGSTWRRMLAATW